MYRFESPLIEGRLIRRYKRFLSDIRLENGETVVAHCPNTGAMTSCMSEGCKVFLSPSNNPKRKLAYTWEYSTGSDEELICINTNRANKFVYSLLKGKKIKEFARFNKITPEYKFKNSRLDFFLEHGEDEKLLLEIKSVTLSQNGIAMFPDTKTIRGLKHCYSLIDAKEEGFQTCMMFVVLRNDTQKFRIAAECDHNYALGVKKMLNYGVKTCILFTKLTKSGIELSNYILLNE